MEIKKLLIPFFCFILLTSFCFEIKAIGVSNADTGISKHFNTQKINLSDTLKPFLLDSLVGYVIDSAEKATYQLFSFWGANTFKSAWLYTTPKNTVMMEAVMRDGTVKHIVIPDYQIAALRDQIKSIHLMLAEQGMLKPKLKPVYVPCKVEMHVDPPPSDPAFSYVSKYIYGTFIAENKDGNKIKISGEVYTPFLYADCYNGQIYDGEYDKNNPDDFIVYDCSPTFLDSEKTERTIATVTSINPESVEFSFTPKGRTKSISQSQKIDEWYDQPLWIARPDIINDRKFFVDYSDSCIRRAVLEIDEPADTTSYFYKPHNYLIGTGLIPIRNFRIDCEKIVCPSFCNGFMYAWWYPQREYSGTQFEYSSKYYQFSHFSALSPYLEWFPGRNAPYGIYFKAWANIAHAQSLLANYVNHQHPTVDSTVSYYVSLDSTSRSYLASKTFDTWGFGISIGGRFYIDQKYHWSVYGSIGYNYLHTPSELKKPLHEEHDLYYLYDFPVWKEILNQPFFAECGIQYRF